jgi:hypothetical protein
MVDKGIWALVFFDSLFGYEDAWEQMALLLHREVFGCSTGGDLWCRQNNHQTPFIAVGHRGQDGLAISRAHPDKRRTSCGLINSSWFPSSRKFEILMISPEAGLSWCSLVGCSRESTGQNGQERHCIGAMLWHKYEFTT